MRERKSSINYISGSWGPTRHWVSHEAWEFSPWAFT